MNQQLTLLAHKPEPIRIEVPKNTQAYRIGEDVLEWMNAHYFGTKPRGGIWSSTFTPEKPEPCAWVGGIKKHPILSEITTESDALSPMDSRSEPIGSGLRNSLFGGCALLSKIVRNSS